jgi:POT family proton-dependent oligopeptide transporter
MSAASDRDKAFFGHPAGLSTLFFTEMWERFSYYGMRAFLLLFMVGKVEEGGRGMSDVNGGIVMALYTASVYMLSLPGGWIADRFLGQRKAVIYGGVGILAGATLLALPVDELFFPGLAMGAIGTGLLKPNVSTIVGQLYAPDDPRRDAGFTIYYMGINIGAFGAPLACGTLAQSSWFRGVLANHGIDPGMCWHFAFGLVAIGMAAGIIQYVLGWQRMGDAGLHPTIPTNERVAARDRNVLKLIVGVLFGLVGLFVGLSAADVSIDPEILGNVFGIGLLFAAVGVFYGLLKNVTGDERKRVIAMIPLFVGGIAFFAIFEQASTTMNLFAERVVHRAYLGFDDFPASYYQAVNSIFIIVLATPFAAIWLKLAKANREPSSVVKFGIGMIFSAASIAVLIPTISQISEISNLASLDSTIGQIPYMSGVLDGAMEPSRASGTYLVVLYFFATLSELCISPVGLSSMSKLAPKRMAGMVMGTWFLATAIGNYLAGRAAGFTESRGYGFLFWMLVIGSFIVAAALFLIAPMIKRMTTITPSRESELKPAD